MSDRVTVVLVALIFWTSGYVIGFYKSQQAEQAEAIKAKVAYYDVDTRGRIVFVYKEPTCLIK